ncbi:MAG: phosphate ABC transporter substrate-binding protein [Bacteroidota bacterium]
MKKGFLVVALFSVLTLVAVAYGASLIGAVQIVGSTSVQPLAEELAQAFMAKNSGVKIFVQGGGSGAGITAAINGTANIGNSSRELKPEEAAAGIHKTVIAKDCIVIIVHPSNSVNNLTVEQIQKIYLGEISNWKEVGGPNLNIALVNREASSGTRGAFEELVMGKMAGKISNKSLVQASTGAVQQTVAVTKEAIGYISLGSLDPKAVKALRVNGVAATERNVSNKTYQLWRPFLMLTKAAPNGVTKAFLDWVLSPEGQKIVARDFIPVK